MKYLQVGFFIARLMRVVLAIAVAAVLRDYQSKE